MSCTYKVSTEEKKLIVQEEIFQMTKDGKFLEARIEQTWRWGYAVITDVEKDSIDPANPQGFEVTGYDIDDQDFQDGVSTWCRYSDNVPDEMRIEFERAWEDDGYEGVENLGWSQWDVETFFYGPLKVELLEEVADEESEEDIPPSAAAWPFPGSFPTDKS